VFAVDDLRQRNGSANGEAILISFEWWNRVRGSVEVVLCIERRITKKLENASVQLVCSGTGRCVDLRNRPAVFGVEQARLHFEFLQRVNRGQEHVAVEVQIRVLDSIQRVVVKVDPLPTDVQGEAVALASHALLSLT